MKKIKLLVLITLCLSVEGFSDRIPYSKYKDSFVSLGDYMLIFPYHLYKKTFLSKLGTYYLEGSISQFSRNNHIQCIRWGQELNKRVCPMLRESFQGGVIVDVGDVEGVHPVLMALYCPDFEISAYQPDLPSFRLLNINLMQNFTLNIDTYRYLLSNKNIEMKDYKGWPVESKKLDSLIIKKLALVRGNLRGADRNFISGAKATLKRDMPPVILTLLSPEKLRNGTGKDRAYVKNVIRWMKRIGYKAEVFIYDDYLFTKGGSNFPNSKGVRSLSSDMLEDELLDEEDEREINQILQLEEGEI